MSMIYDKKVRLQAMERNDIRQTVFPHGKFRVKL